MAVPPPCQPANLPAPPTHLSQPCLPSHRFLHTFIALAVTITAFGLFVAETLDIVIGAALAAMIMLLTGERSGNSAITCRCSSGAWLNLAPGITSLLPVSCQQTPSVRSLQVA